MNSVIKYRIYKKSLIFLIFVIISLSFINPSYSAQSLKEWRDFIESGKSSQLIKWLKEYALNELRRTKRDVLQTLNIKTPKFYGRLGIFVTIKKDGKVRGCYGSFNPSSHDIYMVLGDYLKNALRSDFRYKPISLEELPSADIIITITSQPYPINDLNTVDISHYGVMIKSEDHMPVVFVPSEIKTHSYMKSIIKRYNNPNLFVFKSLTISN